MRCLTLAFAVVVFLALALSTSSVVTGGSGGPVFVSAMVATLLPLIFLGATFALFYKWLAHRTQVQVDRAVVRSHASLDEIRRIRDSLETTDEARAGAEQ